MAASDNISNGAGMSDSKCPVNHADRPAPASKPSSMTPPRKGPGLLAHFKVLRRMSKRALPTANADGTYTKTLVRPKFRQDLSRIGKEGT